MGFVCSKCGKKVKQFEGFVRCSYCGSRVLVKDRPNIAKEVTTD